MRCYIVGGAQICINSQEGRQVHTTVIGSGEKCNQMSLGKTFKAIHYTFMSAYNQLKIIVVAEFHDTIRLQYQTL